MNLQKLFDLQRQLDERIEQEHPRKPGEDRLAKKNLALLVELGELANEWRGFKFWSHDQEPRTEEKIYCRYCGGQGEGYFAGHTWTGKKEKCIFCNGTGIMGVKNPLLEKYVDGLYFLFSIGLEENIGILDEVDVCQSDDITSQFLELFDTISNLPYDISEYPYIFGLYLGLGEMLGFTWEEIEESYFKKNRENHERQNNGY
ncbi:dUTPase [Caldibacillus phage CBP1]|uniref:dUTPase n=1 Tax=Caldibacillus debilis GB1 TaxID=1339248 RepID=A0A420VJJ0_9BACI|nr:dUTP diphosphatase [Caldibacillus debilis]ATB52712.1 dUTPase [Caldibacillus phage CBP1]RKO63538.1 hypothetical protein Cdeb_02801 [Caldibacillus debilis GB1]